MKCQSVPIYHTMIICLATAAMIGFSEWSSLGSPVSDIIGAAIFVPFAFMLMVAVNIRFNRVERSRESEAAAVLATDMVQSGRRSRFSLGSRLPERIMKLQTRTSFIAMLGGIFIVSLSQTPLVLRIALLAMLCLYEVVTFFRFISARHTCQ